MVLSKCQRSNLDIKREEIVTIDLLWGPFHQTSYDKNICMSKKEIIHKMFKMVMVLINSKLI